MRETKGHPAVGAWARPPIGKKPETPPAESAFRIAPVCKEPSAAREQGSRDHRVTVLICTHLPKARKITRLGLYGTRRSASTVRQVQPAEEPAESAARRAPVLWKAPVKGASREPHPGDLREPGLGEVAVEATRNKGQVNVKLHCVFYLKNHDC